MQPLLSAAQMRQADRETIEAFLLPELILMEHAGAAVAAAIEARFQRVLPQTRGVIIAGPGNNGGDAFVAARLLFEKGCQNIFVALLERGRELSPSTALQLKILGRLGIAWGQELSPDLLEACDWIIDGILGTGLARDVEGPIKEDLKVINSVSGRKWIVSIDVPSGLDADTGNPRGIAVHASQTVTLGFLKKGLFTGQAADYVGHVQLATIQIPRAVSSEGWNCFLYGEEDARRLPKRRPASHKGSFGHVGIIAGPEEKQGAAAISSVGALRAGAGLVTVAADAATLDSLRPRLPREIMTATLSTDFLSTAKQQALVIGPGLGLDATALGYLQTALGSELALVIDADALTLMGGHAEAMKKIILSRQKRGLPTVLTPHPKEAARLIGGSVEDIERDRYAASQRLVEQWQAVVLLKGKGTVVGSPEMPTVVVDAGDSGLAKGGTGDLLAGLIASFLAQGMKAAHAVPLGAFIHGKASERMSQIYGEQRSSFASEIADQVPWVLRELECKSIP